MTHIFLQLCGSSGFYLNTFQGWAAVSADDAFNHRKLSMLGLNLVLLLEKCCLLFFPPALYLWGISLMNLSSLECTYWSELLPLRDVQICFPPVAPLKWGAAAGKPRNSTTLCCVAYFMTKEIDYNYLLLLLGQSVIESIVWRPRYRCWFEWCNSKWWSEAECFRAAV